jgi:hypothetical protein
MPNLPSEHDEQVALCHWLDLHDIVYFAVPNGGIRNVVTATRLKAEGVKRGVPDLIVLLPNGINVALEMKARESGRILKEQQQWLDFFSSRPGWRSVVAHGAQEAIKALDELASVAVL